MDLIRIDVLSVFDIRVETAREADALARRLAGRRRSSSRMENLLSDSYGWIFYEDQHSGFELYDLLHLKHSENTAGTTIRFNTDSRIGTCIVWRQYGGGADPLEWGDAARGHSLVAATLPGRQDRAAVSICRLGTCIR